jgi:hypothetical protein
MLGGGLSLARRQICRNSMCGTLELFVSRALSLVVDKPLRRLEIAEISMCRYRAREHCELRLIIRIELPRGIQDLDCLARSTERP